MKFKKPLVSNVLKKSSQDKKKKNTPKGKKKTRKASSFNWKMSARRMIALKIVYFGHLYNGLAYQSGQNVNTVEGALFRALEKVVLIPKETEIKDLVEQKENENEHAMVCRYIEYSRCGRTDRGVSGMNVLGLKVRSQGNENYMLLLNKVLPEDIRVVQWGFVHDSFHARFDCRGRIYRYFFVKNCNLDVKRMEEASMHLLGTHDFRNYCKINVAEQKSFERELQQIKFVEYGPTMYYVEIKGSSFLWHMIRCIMAVLFLVGEGKEETSITKDLLDIEKYPKRPSYLIAPAENLILHDCLFEKIDWRTDINESVHGRSLILLRDHLQRDRDALMVKTSMYQCVLEEGVLGQKLTSNDKPIEWNELEIKAQNAYVPMNKKKTDLDFETKKKSWQMRQERKKEAQD